MTEPTKNIDRNEESEVAIAARTTLDAAREASQALDPADPPAKTARSSGPATGSNARPSREGADQIPLIMGALEKLASATDLMAQQLGERLDEVRAEFTEDLQSSRGGDLRPVLAEGLDAVVSQIDARFSRAQAEQDQQGRRIEQITGELGTQTDQLRETIEAARADTRVELGELRAEVDKLGRTLNDLVSLFTEKTDAIASRVHDARDEVREEIASARRELGDSLQSLGDELRSGLDGARDAMTAALREQVQPVQEALSTQRAEIAKSQRAVVGDLAEGIALSQASMEKRFDTVESSLGAWRDDSRTLLEKWNHDQSERMATVERESREVGELGRRLERNHTEMMELFEHEKQRADQLERDRRRDQARRVNNSGVARYHSGDFEQARRSFEQAVDLDQTFPEAFNNLGLCLTELGEHDEATVAFEAAIELNPDLGASYNNLGYVLYLQENFEAAIEMYKEAIGREHDTSAAYTNLGNAYQKLRETEKAVDAWRQALEVDPTNERAKQYLERFAGSAALASGPTGSPSDEH